MNTPANILERLLRLIEEKTSLIAKEDLSKLLNDDVQWTFPVSIEGNVGGTHEGIDAVAELLVIIFTKIYNPDCFRYQFNGFFGNEEFAAARYRVVAKTAWNTKYENEYALLVRVQEDRITELWEFLDTMNAKKQLYPSPSWSKDEKDK